MKKKILCLGCLLLVLTVCFCGCAKSKLNKINKMLEKSYSDINIQTVSEKGDEKLTSNFAVHRNGNKVVVVYNVQQWATFDGENVPEDEIVTYRGEITVANGTVVDEIGDKIDGLAIENVADVGFVFSQSCLKNIKHKKNTLTADVSDPQAFLRNNKFACVDGSMSVYVEYDDILKKVVVSYTSTDGCKVTTQYLFK